MTIITALAPRDSERKGRRVREDEPQLEPSDNVARPDWTPALAKAAYAQALDGDLEAAADLCDALLSDGRIRGVMQTRINGLLGCALGFEALGDGRRSKSVIKALEGDGEFWKIVPEWTLTRIAFWGLLLNLVVCEITWERDEEIGDWMPRVHPKHPRNLRWDARSRKLFLKVATPSSGGFDHVDEIEVTAGDGRWVVYQPFGAGTTWMQGLWWPLALVWLAKAYADYDWGRRNEARGRSALVGTTPDGSGDDDRISFARQIALLKKNFGIALPPGYDLKAIEFGADDHQTFEARIQAADAAIAILVLGQNLTTEVRQSGSYAAGRSQERVRQDYLESDAETLSTWLRNAVLTEYTRVRFNDPYVAPYPRWNTTPAENLAQRANIVARASEALDRLLARGVPVDFAKFCGDFGIPIIAGQPLAPPSPSPARPQDRAKRKDDEDEEREEKENEDG